MSEVSRKRPRYKEDFHERDSPQLSTKRARNDEEIKLKHGKRSEEGREQIHSESRHDRHRDRSPAWNRQSDAKDRKANRGNNRSGSYTTDRSYVSELDGEKSRRFRDSSNMARTSIPSESSLPRHNPSVTTRLQEATESSTSNPQGKSSRGSSSVLRDGRTDHLTPDTEISTIEQIMGFSSFGSTKNTKVPGNNVGSIRKDKHIKARQYMNRVGGFNRPLSPSR